MSIFVKTFKFLILVVTDLLFPCAVLIILKTILKLETRYSIQSVTFAFLVEIKRLIVNLNYTFNWILLAGAAGVMSLVPFSAKSVNVLVSGQNV